MELLSNFAWLAVAISLWGLWLLRRRDGRKKSLLSTIAAEAIPLAVLTVMLLPAISITDDLHACQLPAEIRRSDVQSDRHHVPVTPPNDLPLALALLVFWKNPADSRSIRLLAVEPPAAPAMHVYFRALSSRPPPVR